MPTSSCHSHTSLFRVVFIFLLRVSSDVTYSLVYSISVSASRKR